MVGFVGVAVVDGFAVVGDAAVFLPLPPIVLLLGLQLLLSDRCC